MGWAGRVRLEQVNTILRHTTEVLVSICGHVLIQASPWVGQAVCMQNMETFSDINKYIYIYIYIYIYLNIYFIERVRYICNIHIYIYIYDIYIYIYKLPSCIILRSEHVLCSDFNMYYV